MGQYSFQLQFRLHKDGEAEYLVRSNPSYFMDRSAAAELDLEAGQYCVMVKITASRNKSAKTPADVLKETCEARRDKLMAVGLSYDLAHAKGGLKEGELEHDERTKGETRNQRRDKAKKIFDYEKANAKRLKLKRLREEAKQKAKEKMKEDANKDQKSNSELGKPDTDPMGLPKPEETNIASEGPKPWSQELSSKEIKIIIEVNDKTGSGKSEESKKLDDVVQPAMAGEQQVATPPDISEGGKSAEGDKYVTTTEKVQKEGTESSSSTAGITPSTSSEGKTTAEGGNKNEEQIGVDPIKGDKANINENTAGAPDVPLSQLTLDTISDDGLSWASDVDVPLDSPSESSSSDSEEDEPAPEPAKDDENDGKSAPPQDRWNAVCVFGVRVYSKGCQAEIEVVRKEDEGGSVGHNKLDIDDQAADATKKLQKRSTQEDNNLDPVGATPIWQEESKQG